MGKKGSWIAAIKRAFTPNSKEKLGNEFEKRRKKEKNKGVGKLRNGESNSFIPLFREPSSVEKIFLDFEREQERVTFRPSSPPITPPFVTPRNNASPRISSARRPSPPVSPPRNASPTFINRPKGFRFRPEPTLRNHHASATKIQAAYKGYVARRSFRALKGLVRLQGVVRGQNVKRQTMNAMKQMQLLVRVQSQIQSRRIQMLESQSLHHVPNHEDIDRPALAKLSFTQASEAAGNQEADWDDSLLTREEIEERLQRKAEAIVKRERAMAYAYSHQLWKASPNSAQTAMADIRGTSGFPWWWNWLERQLPSSSSNNNNNKNNNISNSEPQTLKNFLLAPQTPQQTQTTTTPTNNKNSNIDHHHHDHQPITLTPKSTKSAILITTPKPSRPSPNMFRTPPPGMSRSFSRARGSIDHSSPLFFDVGIKDDESLTSCPPFSVPHYMAPTVSAKAKLRGCSTPTPITTTTNNNNSQSKTRISFPFKWNNKPNLLFSSNSSNKNLSPNINSQRGLDYNNNNNNNNNQSMGNLSVDSSISLPAGIGRKPFNRFV